MGAVRRRLGTGCAGRGLVSIGAVSPAGACAPARSQSYLLRPDVLSRDFAPLWSMGWDAIRHDQRRHALTPKTSP